MKRRFQFVCVAIMALLSSCAFKNEPCDLILHNAKIYTVDDEFNTAEAIAIKDGKIIAIGPEREILNKYSAAQSIDCGKKIIYPGWIDAHCHFLAYGITLSEANIVNTTSFDDVMAKLQAHAASNKSPWLIGRGWDQNDWAVASDGLSDKLPFPDRQKLDEAFPNTPVYLTRIDGHAALVNQKALELAGITPNTQIAGGSVEVINGRCTGILVDNAMNLVTAILPKHSRADKAEALLKAQEKCFAQGITTVHEAGLMRDDITLIDSLQKAGALSMRVYAMMSDDPKNLDYYLANGIDTSSQFLTVRSFKFYADGALGSRGACLLTPYEDLLSSQNRKYYGFLLDSIDHYRKRAQQLYDMGFQMNTHAIGDSANRVMLSIYGSVLQGTNDRRWRIEHAQVVSKQDIGKFAEYSIIPSVQPTHATSDMPWAWERLGRNRMARAYCYKELKEQLGLVALGTDFPVEDISPYATFKSAVFRQNVAGEPSDGFQVENALAKQDALRGMTIWPAIAGFEENKKGTLEVGKFADMILVDTDLMNCSSEQVLNTKVKLTLVGGKVVYQGE